MCRSLNRQKDNENEMITLQLTPTQSDFPPSLRIRLALRHLQDALLYLAGRDTAYSVAIEQEFMALTWIGFFIFAVCHSEFNAIGGIIVGGISIIGAIISLKAFHRFMEDYRNLSE